MTIFFNNQKKTSKPGKKNKSDQTQYIQKIAQPNASLTRHITYLSLKTIKHFYYDLYLKIRLITAKPNLKLISFNRFFARF